MRKIAIFTLNGYYNYGNRLQNYATQEVLRNLGFNVETINVNNKLNSEIKNPILLKISIIRKMKMNDILKKIHQKVWFCLNKNKYKIIENYRTKVFRKFTDDNIIEIDLNIYNDNFLNELATNYDYFITGSDQVWNPDFNYGSSIYFLTFAPKHKRVAFSPSFGVSKIPLEYHDKYKKWINEIDFLSVREDAGANIIKDLTGKHALVLIDPTMMLSKEQWLSISNKVKNVTNKKYLLTYFLGGVPSEYKEKIKRISKEDNLQVINLCDIKDCETYQTGPAEFIEYINSASVFCTDSFHGAVFSILMETPFIVFERKENSDSMFSRIDTLLKKFNLESRKADRIISHDQVFNVDFTHIPPILEAEREKTFVFLKKAIGVNDGIN